MYNYSRYIHTIFKNVGGTEDYDDRIVSRSEGVAPAKEGQIRGVGIAHRKDTEYLKAIPDGDERNNLSSLPTISK